MMFGKTIARTQLLGALLVVSGLLELLGVAAHFSPALLFAGAFIATMGGATLLAGLITPRAHSADELLVLDEREPAWLPQLTGLQEEARALHRTASQLLATDTQASAQELAQSSARLMQSGADIAGLLEKAEQVAEQARSRIEALRFGASAAEPVLVTLNELAGRGNLLALNAAIAGSRGDPAALADFAETVRQFAVEARQAMLVVSGILDTGNRAADDAMKAAHDISHALRAIGEAAGQLQWSAEHQHNIAAPPNAAWYDDAQRLEASAHDLLARTKELEAA